MCSVSKNISMGFTKKKFPSGTHICLIYRDEKERHKIISKYLEAGLLTNEKVVYLADRMKPQEVIQWLEEMDIELCPNKAKKQLSVSVATTAYCPKNKFIPDTMLTKIKKLYTKALAENYTNLRATGEMTWALRGIPGSERLLEYESLLNELVVTHPFTGICQYDANKFDGATIFDILQVHPYMITRGQIVKNPAYIQPDEFLKEYANRGIH